MAGSGDLASELPHRHLPVLVREVVAGLAIHPGGGYLDATVGGAGHAETILLASAPDGRLLALDRDPEAVHRASARLAQFGDRAVVVHSAYTALLDVAGREQALPFDAVLFDLGFSSWQVDDPGRGFSFREDGPLDMRYDSTEHGPTAADLLNQLPEGELVDLLFRYGEEPRSRQVARAIVASRPIRSTRQLAGVVEGVLGSRRQAGRHPATRVFQALRIAVNRELDMLETALPQALEALRPGGRLGVITFHSLEDRVVKHFMQREARACVCPPESPVCTCNHRQTLHILTRRPLVPAAAEVAVNPRSRSAKLRIAEKLPAQEQRSASGEVQP